VLRAVQKLTRRSWKAISVPNLAKQSLPQASPRKSLVQWANKNERTADSMVFFGQGEQKLRRHT
jgi:hypothetical protein